MSRTVVNGLFVVTLVASGCNRERIIALPAADNTNIMMEAASVGAAPTGMLDPKVVQIATARIKVQAVDAAVDSIGSIVQSVGGQIRGQAECQDGSGTKTSTLNGEVPAEKLDAVLERIRELGRVEMLTVRSNAVSEEYTDLETRLANEKAFEASLLRLLDRKTDDLAALVQIQAQISRTRGGIDQMEGQRRALDRRIALSTLEVALHQPAPQLAVPRNGPLQWLRASFRQAGENFLATLAWLVGALGVIVPVGLAAFGLARLLEPVWRRMKRTRRA
jgi:hypothetical protein